MKQPSLQEFSVLLAALYDGHIEEDPYSTFLTGLRAIIDANFASITMREPASDDGGLLFVSCDKLQKTFINDHENPYTDRYYTSNLMTNLPWGQVVSLDECHPYSKLEDTDLYNFCMKPLDIHHMLGVDLRNANGQRFSVRFCRPKTAANFEASSRDFLTMLSNHIQRAVANGAGAHVERVEGAYKRWGPKQTSMRTSVIQPLANASTAQQRYIPSVF